MQLPSEILTVLERLLHEVDRSNIHVSTDLLRKANTYLKDFKADEGKIFEHGRYTDFEMLLFVQSHVAQLRKDEKALKMQIGMLQSNLQEQDDIISQLQSDIKNRQKKLNAALNLKKGERQQLQLNTTIQRLENQVDNLKNENATLKAQLKASKVEMSNLINRFYQNHAA